MEGTKKAPLGDSQAAGRLAIAQTIGSRVLVNIPTLILPPLALAAMQKRGMFRGPRGPLAETATNLGASALDRPCEFVLKPAQVSSAPLCSSLYRPRSPSFRRKVRMSSGLACKGFPDRATGSVDPNKLEERFHGVKDPSTGRPLSIVHFNKGL